MQAFGVYRGRLTDVSQLDAASRVRVSVPQLGIENSWAPVVYNCSAPWAMQVGAQVIVAFENGDKSHPVVLGQIN